MSEQPSLNGDGTITIKTSSWNRVVRERDEAREESEQQARLLGISAEREYALRGKIFELERKILQLEAK